MFTSRRASKSTVRSAVCQPYCQRPRSHCDDSTTGGDHGATAAGAGGTANFADEIDTVTIYVGDDKVRMTINRGVFVCSVRRGVSAQLANLITVCVNNRVRVA